MMERAEAALRDSKFLEFRLDSLPNPAALPKLKEFLAAHRDVTAIATCRRKPVWRQLRRIVERGA
jgi:3-dehydroquinate dehydratase/shikimate dehydrogenase